jgi:hypothetical protein
MLAILSSYMLSNGYKQKSMTAVDINIMYVDFVLYRKSVPPDGSTNQCSFHTSPAYKCCPLYIACMFGEPVISHCPYNKHK